MRIAGPVFWYDLVRVARRQPLALWRAGYGLALLTALFILYASALPGAWLGGHVPPKDAASFGTQFFNVFIAVQFAAVFLMTPALTANAVAEERSNNTLPFLLTTHLSNREIILGKLFTRLLQVGLLIMTGLPVLAIVQLLGGVEPNLVFASFAALTVTALSLGSLGLFCGVFIRKPQNAAWRAYQILIAYLLLSFGSIWYWDLPSGPRGWAYLIRMAPTRFTARALPRSSQEPEFLEQFLTWFNYPNPYYAHLVLEDLQVSAAASPWLRTPTPANTLDEALVKVLRNYAVSHIGFALLLGGLSIWRLRASAAKQSAGITHKKMLILRPAPHPRVRNRPVLWKEMYCESKPRQRWLRLFFGRWFFFASFFPAFFFILFSLEGIGFSLLAERTMFMLRFVGTLVVGLLCLRVALHAARAIGGERDRQTLDSLLTTQLRPMEIVRDKWWGSFLSVRWMFLWLVIHWCLGMIPLALSPFALPVLMLETMIYAAFAASLGIYCSVRFTPTRKAITATLLIGLVGTMFLPWAFGKMGTILIFGERPLRPPPGQLYYPRNAYLALGDFTPWPERIGWSLTPPHVLIQSVGAFKSYSYYDPYESEQTFTLVSGGGLLLYGIAAFGLATAAAGRFRRSLPGYSIRADVASFRRAASGAS